MDGLNFRVIQKGSLVLPSRREKKRVVAFVGWNRVLKRPGVLKDERVFLKFVFVAHHITWVRRGDAQNLGSHIADEFAALYFRQRGFDRFLVLHLIVFALGRYA